MGRHPEHFARSTPHCRRSDGARTIRINSKQRTVANQVDAARYATSAVMDGCRRGMGEFQVIIRAHAVQTMPDVIRGLGQAERAQQMPERGKILAVRKEKLRIRRNPERRLAQPQRQITFVKIVRFCHASDQLAARCN